MTKEQITQMSTSALEQAIVEIERRVAKMKALDVSELVDLALYKAELKQRKEHGNC
jgi:hypothetical protein